VQVIDIHPHAIAAEVERYPRSPVGGSMSDWAIARPYPVERLLAEMNGAGIEGAALVHASTVYGYDNSYAADCAANHPGRLVAVGAIDIRSVDAAAQIDYWVRDRGLAGIRIFGAGSTLIGQSADWLDDPALKPAWQRASDLEVPICIQLRFRDLPRLRTVLAAFPHATFILDHCGTPPLADGPPFRAARPFFELAAFANLTLKLTPHVLLTMPDDAQRAAFVTRIVAAFGAERIAWGSNFPASGDSLAALLASAQRVTAGLSERERAAIFHATAQRLYRGLADFA
jgi:L-fuconolactonase